MNTEPNVVATLSLPDAHSLVAVAVARGLESYRKHKQNVTKGITIHRARSLEKMERALRIADALIANVPNHRAHANHADLRAAVEEVRAESRAAA